MRTISLWLLLIGACADDDHRAYALARNDADVAPGAVYRYCKTTADCVLVNVTCNGCCEVAAISQSLQKTFNSAKADACEGYQGGKCDCSVPAVGAVCVDELCTEAPTG